MKVYKSQEEIEKTIKIDENNRIDIIPSNYVWKSKREVKNKVTGLTSLEWITVGYYPDLASICQEFVKDAPRNSGVAMRSINGVIESIKNAEKTIINIFSK
jgi:hypothetical protein